MPLGHKYTIYGKYEYNRIVPFRFCYFCDAILYLNNVYRLEHRTMLLRSYCWGEPKELFRVLPLHHMGTFRIALREEQKLCVQQIDSQDGIGCLFYLSSDTKELFILTLRKIVDIVLKNHHIISDKTYTNKDYNACKRQGCIMQ